MYTRSCWWKKKRRGRKKYLFLLPRRRMKTLKNLKMVAVQTVHLQQRIKHKALTIFDLTCALKFCTHLLKWLSCECGNELMKRKDYNECKEWRKQCTMFWFSNAFVLFFCLNGPRILSGLFNLLSFFWLSFLRGFEKIWTEREEFLVLTPFMEKKFSTNAQFEQINFCNYLHPSIYLVCIYLQHIMRWN